LSPLDGSLHFIDDRLVLKLTDDLKVKVVAGTPLHCHATTGSSSNEHSQHSKQRSDGNNSDNISGADTSTAKVYDMLCNSCHQIVCFKVTEELHLLSPCSSL
jgi:hypothetical protein